MNFDLDAAIYARYLVPTKRPRSRRIGVEFELPIVNCDHAPVDYAVVHRMTEAFVSHFGFTEIHRDDNGFIYSAIDAGKARNAGDPAPAHSAAAPRPSPETTARNPGDSAPPLPVDAPTGDDISFDCSYNTLEFSMGAEEDLNVIFSRFRTYYAYVKEQLEAEHHTLTGMGINPRYAVNRYEPVESGRYRMLYHHLCSYLKYEGEIPFHDDPNYGMFCCSSQVQLDVHTDDLTDVLNTFSRLEPLKALIFANSLWGEERRVLLSRDNFWRNSLHGLNRHNVDMYGLEFDSEEEVLRYIRSMSLYCTERDGRYINFRPTPLRAYFEAEEITGEYYDRESGLYRPIRFRPEPGDLLYLRSYKFEDLTFRGTVEFRSVCEQPVREILAPAAYHVGLMRKLPELTQILKEDHVIYHQGYNAAELRRMFVRRDLPDIFDRERVVRLELQILQLAEDGLAERGLGEERFLAPLWRRAETLASPAREMADGLDAGKSLEWYIEDYGAPE